MKDLEAEYADKLLNAHINSIADTYSERDLQSILDFYETPLGKRLASMSEELVPKIQAQFASDSARIEVLIQDRLKKGGY